MTFREKLMPQYTCREYRQEMLLMGLRRQLLKENLSDADRKRLLDEIRRLEKQMEMD